MVCLLLLLFFTKTFAQNSQDNPAVASPLSQLYLNRVKAHILHDVAKARARAHFYTRPHLLMQPNPEYANDPHVQQHDHSYQHYYPNQHVIQSNRNGFPPFNALEHNAKFENYLQQAPKVASHENSDESKKFNDWNPSNKREDFYTFSNGEDLQHNQETKLDPEKKQEKPESFTTKFHYVVNENDSHRFTDFNYKEDYDDYMLLKDRVENPQKTSIEETLRKPEISEHTLQLINDIFGAKDKNDLVGDAGQLTESGKPASGSDEDSSEEQKDNDLSNKKDRIEKKEEKEKTDYDYLKYMDGKMSELLKEMFLYFINKEIHGKDPSLFNVRDESELENKTTGRGLGPTGNNITEKGIQFWKIIQDNIKVYAKIQNPLASPNRTSPFNFSDFDSLTTVSPDDLDAVTSINDEAIDEQLKIMFDTKVTDHLRKLFRSVMREQFSNNGDKFVYKGPSRNIPYPPGKINDEFRVGQAPTDENIETTTTDGMAEEEEAKREFNKKMESLIGKFMQKMIFAVGNDDIIDRIYTKARLNIPESDSDFEEKLKDSITKVIKNFTIDYKKEGERFQKFLINHTTPIGQEYNTTDDENDDMYSSYRQAEQTTGNNENVTSVRMDELNDPIFHDKFVHAIADVLRHLLYEKRLPNVPKSENKDGSELQSNFQETNQIDSNVQTLPGSGKHLKPESHQLNEPTKNIFDNNKKELEKNATEEKMHSQVVEKQSDVNFVETNIAGSSDKIIEEKKENPVRENEDTFLKKTLSSGSDHNNNNRHDHERLFLNSLNGINNPVLGSENKYKADLESLTYNRMNPHQEVKNNFGTSSNVKETKNLLRNQFAERNPNSQDENQESEQNHLVLDDNEPKRTKTELENLNNQPIENINLVEQRNNPLIQRHFFNKQGGTHTHHVAFSHGHDFNPSFSDFQHGHSLNHINQFPSSFSSHGFGHGHISGSFPSHVTVNKQENFVSPSNGHINLGQNNQGSFHQFSSGQHGVFVRNNKESEKRNHDEKGFLNVENNQNVNQNEGISPQILGKPYPINVPSNPRQSSFMYKEHTKPSRVKRSLPLLKLFADPNVKLDMPKTIENVGTIAKNSFEDEKAPMYHIRNMVGSAKNVILSALRIPPQDAIIPTQYKILDRKYLKKYPQEMKNPQVGSRFRENSEDSDLSDQFVETFQKLGSMLRESIKSGQETLQHMSDVAHSVRKAMVTTRYATPRLLLPYSRATAIKKDRNPEKVMLITPRIADIAQDDAVPNISEDFMKIGDLMDAFGVSNPARKKVGLTRFIMHPRKSKINLQSRFGNEGKKEENKYFIVAENIEDNEVTSIDDDLDVDDLNSIIESDGVKSLKAFMSNFKDEISRSQNLRNDPSNNLKSVALLKSIRNNSKIRPIVRDIFSSKQNVENNFSSKPKISSKRSKVQRISEKRDPSNTEMSNSTTFGSDEITQQINEDLSNILKLNSIDFEEMPVVKEGIETLQININPEIDYNDLYENIVNGNIGQSEDNKNKDDDA